MTRFARSRQAALGAAIWAGLTSYAHSASADDAEARKAEAKRLFEQGSAAVTKGDTAKGCALIRQSLELFVVANSLFNAALCDEREGKLRAALGHWRRGLSLVEQRDPRFAAAKRSIAALESRAPRVKINVPEKIAPVTVEIDGEEIPQSEVDSLVIVDPGKHIVTIRKQGYQDKQIDIAVDERLRTEVVAELGPAVAQNPKSTSTIEDLRSPQSSGSGLRVGAFVALGIGVLGAVGASVTSGMIASNDVVIDTECVGLSCDRETYKLVEEQRTLLPVNAVMWGVGAVGISTSVLLFVLASKTEKPKASEVVVLPIPAAGGAGIGLSGRF